MKTLNHTFADKICDQVKLKKSHAVIGLDPDIRKLPDYIVQQAIKAYGYSPEGAAYAFLLFNQLVIDSTSDLVAVVKPQLAYYEVFGAAGMETFWKTVEYARSKGLLVIADAKRADISTTAEAYALAYLAQDHIWKSASQYVDCITINPYLGSDGLLPFTSCSKNNSGVFILLKTSNPSAGELQDLTTNHSMKITDHVSEIIIRLQHEENSTSQYSSIGAVIGASYPKDLAYFRGKLPRSIFLVPGYGTQGEYSQNITYAFNSDGLGALINASRSIIYSYGNNKQLNEEQIAQRIRNAVITMNNDINTHLIQANKCAW